MKVYEYIFYRFFRFIRFEKDYAGRVIAACFSMALLFTFNIASVVFLFKVIYKLEFPTKLIFSIVFILISILNFDLFFIKDKYKNIIERIDSRRALSRNKFAKNNEKRRGPSSFPIALYITLSIIILAFSVLADAVVGDFRLVFRFLEQKFIIK